MSRWKELLDKKAKERQEKANPKAVEAALVLFLESLREMKEGMDEQAKTIGKKINWETLEIE